MNAIHWIAVILLIVGGLNWGLVGLFDGMNLVEQWFGTMPVVVQTIYIAVGVSALWRLYDVFIVKK